ncbi:MAG: DUF2863 family protein [Burkholderiaceae bacterium]|nr:DUF2863 family protein [Burkholderiaceae bacterium]
MARFRARSGSKLNRDAQRLVSLATGLDRSGSRVEDRFWEDQLGAAIPKLLKSGQDDTLEAALDHLSELGTGAYEVLIEQAETLSESTQIERDGQLHDVLLVVAPLVAFTRYVIPQGPLSADVLATLTAQLHGHILADNVNLSLVPALVSVDQMPRTFSETWAWLSRLGQHSLTQGSTAQAPHSDTETAPMLADTRYVVAAVSAPVGAPVFRWQTATGDPVQAREQALADWTTQLQPTFASLLPGCGFELLLPDAYYLSNREADRRLRPLSLTAAVNWLQSSVSLEPSDLRAVIGGCGETRIDEYRISFTARDGKDVFYGCVWPLYGREDDAVDAEDRPTVVDEIAAQLKALGVAEIRQIPGVLPAEFCEDCGTPYFPNPVGEMVHAGLPEDASEGPAHFH